MSSTILAVKFWPVQKNDTDHWTHIRCYVLITLTSHPKSRLEICISIIHSSAELLSTTYPYMDKFIQLNSCHTSSRVTRTRTRLLPPITLCLWSAGSVPVFLWQEFIFFQESQRRIRPNFLVLSREEQHRRCLLARTGKLGSISASICNNYAPCLYKLYKIGGQVDDQRIIFLS